MPCLDDDLDALSASIISGVYAQMRRTRCEMSSLDNFRMNLTDPGSVDAVFEQASTIRASSVTDSALAVLCSRTDKSWTIYS